MQANSWSDLSWQPMLSDVVLMCDQEVTQNAKRYNVRALAVRRDSLSKHGARLLGNSRHAVWIEEVQYLVVAQTRLIDDPRQLTLSL